MRIRAKASPSYVFDAHPDAAKQLIEAGIYEAVSDEESQSAQGSTSPETAVGSPAAAPPKRRTKKSK